MSFASDNWAGAHPKVMDALVRANEGLVRAYGNDAETGCAEALIREVFETDCAVFFVATGTAANGLALSALCPSWGAVLCHRHAHIAVDEGGGPEFYTGGARMLLLDHENGKLTPAALERAAATWPKDNVHAAQPRAVSITNATECGTVYGPAEIAALSGVCRREGWGLHMDGARFANAVAFSGASPADLTWRSGVDILSFGLTKAGALCAEAIVVFRSELAVALPNLRKRAGHLLSKNRGVSAQAVGLLEDGLWLDLARHTNALARDLAQGLVAAGAGLIYPVEANEVFVRLDAAAAQALEQAGVGFYPWPHDGPDAYRFVVGWPVTSAEVVVAVGAVQAARASARSSASMASSGVSTAI